LPLIQALSSTSKGLTDIVKKATGLPISDLLDSLLSATGLNYIGMVLAGGIKTAKVESIGTRDDIQISSIHPQGFQNLHLLQPAIELLSKGVHDLTAADAESHIPPPKENGSDFKAVSMSRISRREVLATQDGVPPPGKTLYDTISNLVAPFFDPVKAVAASLLRRMGLPVLPEDANSPVVVVGLLLVPLFLLANGVGTILNTNTKYSLLQPPTSGTDTVESEPWDAFTKPWTFPDHISANPLTTTISTS
jgi:hypothetical protein